MSKMGNERFRERAFGRGNVQHTNLFAAAHPQTQKPRKHAMPAGFYEFKRIEREIGPRIKSSGACHASLTETNLPQSQFFAHNIDRSKVHIDELRLHAHANGLLKFVERNA